MKLILSRKGFDSSAGGVASPIFPDGSLLSLPIPSSFSPTRYADIPCPAGGHLGDLVSDLTKGVITGDHYAHLDPDLRPKNGIPAFGQSGAAQRHLMNQKVALGDVFVFFGWFADVRHHKGRWQYVPSTDRHIVFGWLQVGEIIRIENPADSPAYLKDHPHLYSPELQLADNTIYVASKELGTTGHPGGGAFNAAHPSRVLTIPGQTKRSIWRLPKWFFPGTGPVLSYHSNRDRWQIIDDQYVKLLSAGRGQEFVVNPEEASSASEWLASLFC